MGATVMLGVQTFVIIAGVLKLIPLTGVTMPFVSYGGTSLVSCMRFLEEADVGVDTGVGKVPIVPAAVLFDLSVGSPKARPDAAMPRLSASSACCHSLEYSPWMGIKYFGLMSTCISLISS